MRFYESRQSATSPVKYRLDLSLEELEKVKEEIMNIIQAIKSDEQSEGGE